jgi:hypothetical protein
MVCDCRHPGARTEPASGVHAVKRWWIDLVLGDRSARVELPKLVAVRVFGRDVARLDDLWAAGRLGVRPAALSFDFIGADGFRLGVQVEGGVRGAQLATGYVCLATRDLLWAPVPERPAFWSVKDVVRVEASPIVSPGR